MKKLNLLYIFILAFSANVFSQHKTVSYASKIDSLEILLKNAAKTDTAKAHQLAYLGQLYICNDQIMKGLILSKQAYEMYQKLNDPVGRGYFLQAMALVTRDAGTTSNDRMSLFYIKAKWHFDQMELSETFPLYQQMHYVQANILESRTLELKKAIAYFEKQGDKEILAVLLFATGYNLLSQNQGNESITYLDRSYVLFKQLNQPEAAFTAYLTKILALKKTSSTEQVKQLEQNAIKQIISSADSREKSLLCLSMFTYYYQIGLEAQALEYLLKAITGFKEINDKQTLIRLYNIAGDEIQIYGSPRKGYEFLQKELALRKELNENDDITYTYITLTFCLIKLKNYDEALKYLSLAEELFNKNDNPYYLAKCFDARGQVLMGQQKFPEAIPYFSKAALIFKDQNNQWSESYQYGYIAGCYYEMGNLDESIRYGNISLDIGKQNNYIPVTLMASKVLSEAHARQGNNQKSYEYLKVYSDTKDKLLQNDIDNRLTDLETQSLVQEAQREKEKLEAQTYIKEKENEQQRLWLIGIGCCLLIVMFAAWFLHKSNRDKKEANKLLNEQKTQIEEAMIHLKATQSQLIQSEKMASLGELTAGIAHEIQNPLNFVNNFSEVNKELIEELKTEKSKPINERDEQLENELLNDIISNEEKINHHGKRADAIVKGMLQHSRSSNGQKEPTNINALTDEYLRLAYHGLRAKDKSFNATLKTDFDESIGNVNIIPQDIGRVVLNLITNAFYVVDEKKKKGLPDYEPTVWVSTKKIGNKVEISVKDNGNGIPDAIKDKIFQPFFTTKPTGQGTGLGLSMSYDIVTKGHAGEIKVHTRENEGTEFVIIIPT